MKLFITVLLFVLTPCVAAIAQNVSPCADLFFSEYIEGSGLNKAIEIYNPTASSITMSDYKFQIYFNGSVNPTTNIALSGTIAAGGVFVLANSAGTVDTGISNHTNQTSGSVSFN